MRTTASSTSCFSRSSAKNAFYRIYVAPEYWNQGIGRLRLERIQQVLKERGFERLVVSVFAKNTVGVQFYEALGFERTHSAYSDDFDSREYEYATNL